MLKKIIDWLNREPSKWEILAKHELIRCRDGKLAGFLIISKDQYGNIRTKRITV